MSACDNGVAPRKRSFAPVVDQATRLLILGSLPGEQSLAAQRYYAHPRNQFWRLVGDVIGKDLPAMAYGDRLATLLRHRIGLWDVVGEASRKGSLDAHIRDHRTNDLAALAQSLPDLRAVAFNGGTSARIGGALLAPVEQHYALVALPSSSPAYTLPLADKQQSWSVLRQWAGQSRTDAGDSHFD